MVRFNSARDTSRQKLPRNCCHGDGRLATNPETFHQIFVHTWRGEGRPLFGVQRFSLSRERLLCWTLIAAAGESGPDFLSALSIKHHTPALVLTLWVIYLCYLCFCVESFNPVILVNPHDLFGFPPYVSTPPPPERVCFCVSNECQTCVVNHQFM